MISLPETCTGKTIKDTLRAQNLKIAELERKVAGRLNFVKCM